MHLRNLKAGWIQVQVQISKAEHGRRTSERENSARNDNAERQTVLQAVRRSAAFYWYSNLRLIMRFCGLNAPFQHKDFFAICLCHSWKVRVIRNRPWLSFPQQSQAVTSIAPTHEAVFLMASCKELDWLRMIQAYQYIWLVDMKRGLRTIEYSWDDVKCINRKNQRMSRAKNSYT